MIILMINYYYWCYRNPIQRPKKDKKQSYSGKRKHTIKTQVIIEQETKNYCNKFFARKNMIMLLF
ncbi:hypothetical protein [Spiroplasma poulsonii]|uniref:hypothetical protein n=1 Tax=Spiroplasma poulsonii TaxID=2138 RepID=UPI001F4D0F30|nr:hypothetical protein [Spiroplasma poulsonii]UNF62309.1 hypothetical protein MNU24_02270 [Spiroplasma poulsonii]